MVDQPDYEYDLAMSFAGEQRTYVEAVVRGLGSDVKVFYDDDERARLLGENLHDLLTDLYRNKARFVAMFVSAAYAEKMWPKVERQSAMSRAVESVTAYILPFRMDDTELPGLLPTVGFVDCRIEGLDGVINILLQKLGHTRVAATYAGRVPRSQTDVELLLALRPRFWEYWLYAGTLRVGLDALEAKYRDYEMGYAPLTGVNYRGDEAFEFLRTAPDSATLLVNNLNKVFDEDVLARALGEPGEPGDPVRIMHITQRFVDVYEGLLDEAARIRGAAVPTEFEDAKQAAAEFGADAIQEVRNYVAKCAESMEALPELVDGRADDAEPASLHLTLRVSLDDAVTRRYVEGMRRGRQSR